MRVNIALIVALFALALAACAPQAAPAPTPSPAPPSDTPTPAESATRAPTMTPLVRPTLPPTWTPDFQPTATAIVGTLRPDATNEALRGEPTLAACASFSEDRERTPRTFSAGEPLTIYWNAARGANRYRVTLYDASFQALLSENTDETSFTFAGDFFELGSYYGWEVRPYNALNEQLCLPIGGDVEAG
ncbi:MAG: hypothetical protein KJ065_13410 [Anaerolineae bacterium]|nr:hypothetical protein [Anaerolineae bacterium]